MKRKYIASIAMAFFLLGTGAAQAQSLGIGKDGSLKIDAGDGNALDIGATGALNAQASGGERLKTPATESRGRKTAPAQRNVTSRRAGDNVQRTVIHGTRINVARGKGATSTQNISGREDVKTLP